MANFEQIFATNVFSDAEMQKRLSPATYEKLHKVIAEGGELDIAIANEIAAAMKDWAMENGATHYTHWFQPMTGVAAEKHDSFLSVQADGTVLSAFSGKKLIKGEPDASSFPSGGLRSTFEARGYTAWDPTSYVFLKANTLCIPTVFCSYSGQVLDKKTPLLRSLSALSNAAVRLLHILGKTEVTHVYAQVGAEQEYFLVDKEKAARRRDLLYTGRTLFGAKPPKTQELDDHYFGSLRPEFKRFMAELDEELWKLGIYATTEHNEAAPSQHELAPIFTEANRATDQNQLTMEIMRNVADRLGFQCLLHEKPFMHINGSGKHDNWSLSTNTGENLFKPGRDPYNNTQFLLFLAAVIKAVDEYQDLLRISVASAANDHRLGASEAPPAIVSIYLGDELSAVLDAIMRGKRFNSAARERMEIGVESVPEFAKDTSDRNRTSPFAFTGNKFEFRMVGSSQSVADPTMVLNTIMANALCEFSDKLMRSGKDKEAAARRLVRTTLLKHSRIIFNGNNYSAEWVAEAEARGLCHYRTAADAIVHFEDEKNIRLFEKHRIFTATEIRSRVDIMLENYFNVVKIEAQTMLSMTRQEILPAVYRFETDLCELIAKKRAVSLPDGHERAIAERVAAGADGLYHAANALDEAIAGCDAVRTAAEGAAYIRDTVLPAMNDVRAFADALETNVGKDAWPFPTYGELLLH
ncbi:MAG: glutamine synthetase III [Clostridia bacterium]|nr:glutamine synthetase III [Clostridia bacterium]